jgi:hypothetical protein
MSRAGDGSTAPSQAASAPATSTPWAARSAPAPPARARCARHVSTPAALPGPCHALLSGWACCGCTAVQEGFEPATFKSSRGERASLQQQKVEDFLDADEKEEAEQTSVHVAVSGCPAVVGVIGTAGVAPCADRPTPPPASCTVLPSLPSRQAAADPPPPRPPRPPAGLLLPAHRPTLTPSAAGPRSRHAHQRRQPPMPGPASFPGPSWGTWSRLWQVGGGWGDRLALTHSRRSRPLAAPANPSCPSSARHWHDAWPCCCHPSRPRLQTA